MIRAITFTYVGTPDMAVSRRGPLGGRMLAQADRKALTQKPMENALLYWHRRLLQHHFWPSAESKYKYTRRTVKYLKRKRIVKGHVRPLVYTGSMRSELMRRITIRGYKSKARGKVKGTMQARVLNVYARPSAPHDIKREITEMTDRETAILVRLVRKQVVKNMKRTRRVRKVTIGRSVFG